MFWSTHSKRLGMFYPDERGIWDSRFVIGPMKGYIVKVSVRECNMEDIKCAVSSMEEKSLELAYLLIERSLRKECLLLVFPWGLGGIALRDKLALAIRHRFVLHAFDWRYGSREIETSFALPRNG